MPVTNLAIDASLLNSFSDESLSVLASSKYATGQCFPLIAVFSYYIMVNSGAIGEGCTGANILI
jgi:hypothetical protein